MKFLVDAMLGRLTRFLRIFGYDTVYANDVEKQLGIESISDTKLFEYALKEGRLIITRDYPFYKKAGNNSIYLKGEGIYNYLSQLKKKLRLEYVFSMDKARCSVCNSPLLKVEDKEQIRDQVEESTFQYQDEFFQCKNPTCQKLFWNGKHIQKILQGLKDAGLSS